MGFIKSPLNYSGNKYKLLPQIVPLFPSKISRFVDLFGGSGTVGVNVDCDNILYNEIDKRIYSLVSFVCNCDSKLFNETLHNEINNRNLGKATKEEYLKLRNDYNSTPSSFLLYLLQCFSFNSQIRFNSKGEFNMPCGNRGYSKNMEKCLFEFNEMAKLKHIEFANSSYGDIHINNSDFVYIDPPYLQTIATYTENGGWSPDKEFELYDYLDGLNNRGIKWAMSNTIKYRGEDNQILMEWAEKYNIHKLDFKYINNNRYNKDNSLETIEVLITNY